MTRSADAPTSRWADGSLTPDRDVALLRALIDIVGAVMVCDAEGNVVGCSPEATALLGPLDGVRGSTVDSLLARLVTRRRHRRAPLVAALTGELAAFVATAVAPEGDRTELLVSVSPLHAPDGMQVIGALMTLQPRDLRSTRTDGQMLGLHDSLTGLLNRRLLADRMQQAIARARRQRGSFVVCMIDLDDTVARIGGDEFVAVCEGIGSTRALESIADRLLAAAVAPVSVRGIELSVGASVGITMADAQEEPDALLHQADLAMYEAKSRGRNNWARFHDGLAYEAHRLAHLVSELRRALAAGTMTVAYQPEVDPASNRSAPPWISVNVSARELVDPHFAQRVLNTLERWSLPGSRLFLELTESILIQASIAAEAQLGRLHAAGVQLAIDDFGTGYASLTHLQRLLYIRSRSTALSFEDFPRAAKTTSSRRASSGWLTTLT
jgi:predicted signal transduction protein with EAL and GGDEF domain